MQNYQQFFDVPPMLIGIEYLFWTSDVPHMVHQYPQDASYTAHPSYANGPNSLYGPSMMYNYGQPCMDAMLAVPPFHGTQASFATGGYYQATFANPVPALPLVDPYQSSSRQAAIGVQYGRNSGGSQQPSASGANGQLSSAAVKKAPMPPKSSEATIRFPTAPVQSYPIQPHGKIVVTLKNEQEWMKYSEETNEMFINNGGKPLFPVLVCEVKGLEPTTDYCVSIHLKRTSIGQMKYSEAKKRWEENEQPDGRAENLTEIFSEMMPGFAWEVRGLASLRRIKIYNVGNDRKKAASTKKLSDEEKLKEADEKSQTMLEVNTQVKYLPILRIYKVSMGEKSLVEEKSFHETEFITVTTYKNQWISLNKTLDNPSAKFKLKENARALIEKENISPGPSSGSSSGYGSPSSGNSDASSSSEVSATKSRKTRKALSARNPRAAKALKLSTPSGACDPSVGYYGSDNSQ